MHPPSLLRAYRAWHHFCRACERLRKSLRSSAHFGAPPVFHQAADRNSVQHWAPGGGNPTIPPSLFVYMVACLEVRCACLAFKDKSRLGRISSSNVVCAFGHNTPCPQVPLDGWWLVAPPQSYYPEHLWPSKVSAAPQRWESGTPIVVYKSVLLWRAYLYISPTIDTRKHISRMAPQPQSSTTGNAPRRHREYFITEGDVTFRVENTLFRLHKFFFYRESPYFQQLFRSPSIPCNDPPGSSETNPVVLKEITSEAFAGLCWIFYNQNYSVYTTTKEKWVEILDLAQKWSFKEVQQLCIREMQKLPIEPVDKIHIYQAFHLDRALLAESFAKLTIRPQPLNLEEGNKLGIETTLQIAQARELSRGSHSGTRTSTIQLNESELHLVIRDAFGLGEESLDFLADALQPPLQPENVNNSRKSKK